MLSLLSLLLSCAPVSGVLSASAAFAADSIEPSCATRDDKSIWFVLTGGTAGGSPTNDFICKGLFFGDISCTNAVGIGRISPTGITDSGYSTHELRYLPYGDTFAIISFFNKPGSGVLYKLPVITAATPAAMPPPPDPEELLRLHLRERAKASAATQGVTVHIWKCPDAKFEPPTDVLDLLGMKADMRMAKAPLLSP